MSGTTVSSQTGQVCLLHRCTNTDAHNEIMIIIERERERDGGTFLFCAGDGESRDEGTV